MRPYPWLVDYLNARLPELEGLRNTPKGLEKARSWFKALLKYFRRRQLKTPRQQKNYVVDVRNAIRSRFGEDHPALKVVGFDEDTWTQINKPIHDSTRLIQEPRAPAPVLQKRLLHRLAYQRLGGEVHHGIRAMLAESSINCRPIRKITGHISRLRVDCRTVALGEIVEYHDRLACSDQLLDNHATDVSRSAGYKDFHEVLSLK
jgi:hypothetical protein